MAKNFRDLRRSKGAFQKDVAAAAEVSVQTVSGWENGVYEPEAPTMPKLAQFFETSVEEVDAALKESKRQAESKETAASK